MNHHVRRSIARKWAVTFALFGLGLIATGVVYIVLDSRQADDRVVQRANAESTNRLVCVTRPYIVAALSRAVRSAADASQSAAARARAREAITANTVFLGGLVTVPPDYDCAPLVKRIKEESRG